MVRDRRAEEASPSGPDGRARGEGIPGGKPEVVRVWLLGGFRVSVGGQAVRGDAWRLRKPAALVKLLALAPGHRLHRERVMYALWPQLCKGAASNNLRQALYVARGTIAPHRVAGARYLALRGEQVVLCPEGRLWVDAEAFEEATAAARRSGRPAAYEAAAELYAGDLLPEDRYEEWAEGRRRELREAYLSLLLELARMYEKLGDNGPAAEAWRKVLSEEPTREEAHTGLMRLHALSGDRAAALERYERMREILGRELGTEPGVSSAALREDISQGRFTPDRESGARTPLGEGPAAHNMPSERTSFVGRGREVVDVKRELAMTRLLTLTGVGGSGKTRLAVEVAKNLAGAYPDGAWLAGLAPLSEPGLVAQEVARALGVPEQSGRPLLDTLIGALRGKEMLVVLDSCEHLLDAAADLTGTLLDACPGVRVLATSRQALGVAGEAVHPVPPLSVPAAAEETGALMRHGATQLFVERARRKLPDFGLTAANARAVAKTCRALGGVPLAIELAAARMDVLTVDQIAERLDRALRILKREDRAAEARHQSLRAMLDWSYELLGETERKLFARVSVFAGGWSLEAAETVGAGDGIGEGEALESFLMLVDKNLVQAEPGESGAYRYGMLEPVRQYARERLEESGEATKVRRRHAEWCLAFAEEAERGWSGPEHAAWTRRLEANHDDLRAVLRWSIDSGDAELPLWLSGALWQFWFEAGYSAEGRGWLEEALSLGGPPAARAKALDGVGYLTTFQSDYGAAKARLEEALALYRGLGDEEGTASALAHLVFYALMGQRGDVDATKLLGEALALRPRIENLRTIADVLSLYLIGSISGLIQEGLEVVAALHEEALPDFREAGYVWGIYTCLTNVGLIRLASGENDRAEALFKELLPLSQESGDLIARLHSIFGLACVASAEGDPWRAARLWGASDAMQNKAGTRLPPITLSFTEYERRVAETRSSLGETEFEEAWAEGQAMSEEGATTYALAATEQSPPSPESLPEPPGKATRRPTALTPREQEVATLVAGGSTNRRIAEELHLSERTVHAHLRNILKKLRVPSRGQVASHLRSADTTDTERATSKTAPGSSPLPFVASRSGCDPPQEHPKKKPGQ
jgi:predicted ATPase/DNA-binding SARP family transcriptional activator/DNA-binding CsgD family transcriptional regulator